MNNVELGRQIIALEAGELQAVADRLDGSFAAAVDAMRTCVEGGGKIVVLGVGKSGHIGEKIAATLTSTGSPAVVLNSLNALHGDLGLVSDGDLILAISYSGETEEMVRIFPALLRFDVVVVALTGRPGSSLGRISEVVLDCSVKREACPLNLAPTSSTTVMLAMGDALAMVLLQARGFTKEDFAKYHPGGRLGRELLMKVGDVMRPAGELAVAGPGTPIREVLSAMTGKRAGAAVVVDDQQRLAGIFTHGDFVRLYQVEPEVGHRSVGEHMTREPVCIHVDKLAVEVLNMLERHRIDDLVVVDDQRHPVGMIDSQDLTRLKLI